MSPILITFVFLRYITSAECSLVPILGQFSSVSQSFDLEIECVSNRQAFSRWESPLIFAYLNSTRHLNVPLRSDKALGIGLWGWECFNILRPSQNGRHFSYDIFKRIFVSVNVWIPLKFSLKFVFKGAFNNIPALVQIMVWRLPGDKQLSATMMVCLPTHICVTRPQWVLNQFPDEKQVLWAIWCVTCIWNTTRGFMCNYNL